MSGFIAFSLTGSFNYYTDLSIVIPVYNQEEYVRHLFGRIQTVCEAISKTFQKEQVQYRKRLACHDGLDTASENA